MDPRFKVLSTGVQWIVDEKRRVIGFVDDDKNEYLIPSVADADKIDATQSRPKGAMMTGGSLVDETGSAVGGGGSASLPADSTITASQNVAKTDAGRTFIVDTTGGAVSLTILNDGLGLFTGQEVVTLYHSAGANAATFAAGNGVTLANPGSLSPAVGAFMSVRRVGVSAWAVIA